MRKFLVFIYVCLITSLVILAAIIIWKFLLEGKSPGFLVSILIVLSAFSAAFCILSIAGIRLGRGQLVARTWLMACTAVCFYFALDIVGGYIFISPTPFRNSPDEYVHHKMLPYTTYQMRNNYGDFNVEMKTNNMGFRGRDIKGKEPGVYRIVMLGDSFTMGEGIGDDQTFSHLVEKYLNDLKFRKYEVIDLGVESYSPVLEYVELKKYIAKLKPDMVVLNFDMSDVLNEYAYRKIAAYDKTGDVLGVNGYPEYKRRKDDSHEIIMNWIYGHLFVTGHIIGNLKKHFGQYESDKDLKEMTVREAVESQNGRLLIHTLDMPQLKETAEIYSMEEDSILRAKNLCGRYNCKFILSVYPWGHQVSDKEWVPGRYGYVPKGVGISDRTVEELDKFSRAQGITFFNAFPYFREYKGGEHLYYSHDMHWTPAGQELMAKYLGQFLNQYLHHGV